MSCSERLSLRRLAGAMPLLLVLGLSACGSSSSAFEMLPAPRSYEETPINSLNDLFSSSETVVVGTISDWFVRETGVWSEAVGKGDTPIYSQDIVLVVEPVGGGAPVEVRFEHLYDNSPGGQPISDSGVKFPGGEFVFSLNSDTQHGDIVEKGMEPYRCSTLSNLCVLQIDGARLKAAPREGESAEDVSYLIPSSVKRVNLTDIGEVAEKSGAETLGFASTSR